MSKVFQIIPKRIKHMNGTVLTPDMVVIVTTQSHTSNPFNKGAKEIQEAICGFTASITRRLGAQ